MIFSSSRNVRARVLMVALFPPVLIFLLLMINNLLERYADAERSLVKKGELLHSLLSDAAVFALASRDPNYGLLLHTVDKIVDRDEILSLEVLDLRREVLFSTGNLENVDTQDRFVIEKPLYVLPEHLNVLDKQGVAYTPEMRAYFAEHKTGRQLMGYMIIKMNRSSLELQKNIILIADLVSSLIVLSLALPIGLTLGRSISEPIGRIVEAVSMLRKGDYQHRIDSKRRDELGQLSDDIDSLATELDRSQQERKAHLMQLTREREKADRANATKTEFLAAMSHETRTPLNGVITPLELLEETPLNHHQKRFIETAHANANVLLRLVDDILAFSEDESGKTSIQHSVFNPREMIDQLVEYFSAAARDKGLELQLEYLGIADSAELLVVSDETRLRQIVTNLLSNAVKFTLQGQVKIRVRAELKEQKTVQLRIEVEDSGIGIDKDNLSSIFDLFHQVDSSSTRRFGGTGLGLTLAKRYAEKLGGNIAVSSQLGKGSTFTLTLDVALVQERRAPESEQRADEMKRDILDEPITVLIAEDNKQNQEMLVQLLSLKGVKAELAFNGEEAFEKFCRNRYDLIFVDCNMPVMDGYELTQKIRAYEQEHKRKRTPIIAISAYVFQENIDECFDVGMDDFLAKPFKKAMLWEKISQTMKRGGAQQQVSEFLRSNLGGGDDVV